MKTPPLSADRLASLEAEMDSHGIGTRMAYDEMIQDGVSPLMAAMLACQKFANIGTTDKTFNKREHDRMKTMDDNQLDVVNKIARKAGINTTGKTYNGALGKYGDPAAWVSGTHDVRQAANQKGLSLRGMVNVNNESLPPKQQPKIAPDILNRLEQQAINNNPSLKEKVAKKPTYRKEIRERIIDRHATRQKKG